MQKRKNFLKFQAVNETDGLTYPAARLIEGRMYDSTLYIKRGLKRNLQEVMVRNGARFRIYADSDQCQICFLEIRR